LGMRPEQRNKHGQVHGDSAGSRQQTVAPPDPRLTGITNRAWPSRGSFVALLVLAVHCNSGKPAFRGA
ncbi:MAG TPA: hypothetical protein VK683_09405, partial [Rhizomicrobium sp.]|nr:hypothetical protein [Rhizomicrobium sp.]